MSETLRLLLIGMFAVTSFGIMGCETTKGVGRDIENVGEEVDEAIDDE